MQKFTINEGNHYSLVNIFSRIIPTFSNHFSKVVRFNQSCIYDLQSNDNYDINKLFGVSRGALIHKDSVRFGWRCLDNSTIEIVSYVYVSGVRLPEVVFYSVRPHQKVVCKIDILNDVYVMSVILDEDNRKTIYIPHGEISSWGFKSWPFFGGNKPAPHEMLIKMMSV